MFVSLSFVTLFVIIVPSCGASETLIRFTALQFTQEPTSFIQFRPDFSRSKHAISVCGWIKSLGSSGYPTVLHYGHHELTLLDNGRWTCILGSCTHMNRKFSVSKGTWYHACVVWSSSSSSQYGILNYYVNGELLGTLPTRSGRLLKTGGELTLGNWGGDNYINHEFGGQIFYLNVYAKAISAGEVRRMVTNGMCANMIVDANEDARILKWEEILEQSRNGAVTDVDLTESCLSSLLSQVIRKLNAGAKVKELETKVKAAENKLSETADELTETRQKLEDVTEDLSRKNGELNECRRRPESLYTTVTKD